MISGAPPLPSAEKREKLHHTLGDYSIPQKIFSQYGCIPLLSRAIKWRLCSVTVGSIHITEAAAAPEQIDKLLRVCIAKQRPVFISLPTDIVHQQCAAPSMSLELQSFASDPGALKECIGACPPPFFFYHLSKLSFPCPLDEAVSLCSAAKRPAILVDALASRCKAVEALKQLVAKSGYPFATPMMGKALLDEDHPQFIGLYAGERSREYGSFARIELTLCEDT